jgi:hypothetical protein
LARIDGEVCLCLQHAPTPTYRSLLDGLEAAYPALRGTLRDPGTLLRRPRIRFFVCGEDCSHVAQDSPLPEAVIAGREPFLIVGAISGG